MDIHINNNSNYINENLKPGNIIINAINNSNYGVIVNQKKNKLIVFRLENNTYPVFSKIDINPNLKKNGHINEYQNEILKLAFLKYISNSILSENEKKMLQPLINFAFPLGVPEYRPEIELPERDQLNLDLGSHLVVGKKIFINTPSFSPYKFLDNTSVDIIDKNDDGIWICKPNNNETLNYFLFYKNKSIPNFSGISRAIPLGETTDYLDKFLENYKQQNNDNQLTTTMLYNGEKVKVLPTNKKVIFPIKYQNLIFEPKTSRFLNDKEYVKFQEYINNNESNKNVILDDYDFSLIKKSREDTKGLNLLVGGGDSELSKKELDQKLMDMDHLEGYRLDEDDDEDQKFQDLISTRNNIDNEVKQLETLFINKTDLKENNITLEDKDIKDKDIENKTSNDKKDNNNNNNNDDNTMDSDIDSDTDFDLDDDDLEFIEEDEIEEGGTFQKIKMIEVADEDKTFKESIQRGDLHKFKLEQIPRLRRNDVSILNKIVREINNISLLKHKLTGEANSIKFTPDDFNPLLQNYLNKNFQNQLLIPLVLNKKNIYLNPKNKNIAEDYDLSTHNVIDKYYDKIKELNTLLNKKVINYDNYINKINEYLNPSTYNEQNIGLLFRLGQNVDKNNLEKINQDVMTIRHCNQDFKCQSFELQTNDFDYQVNLGPLGRYLTHDEEDDRIIDEENIEFMEEKHDKNISYTLGKVKINYLGDMLNVIGFVRPPLSYFHHKKNDEHLNLKNLYDESVKNDNVEIINISDISNTEEDVNDLSNETKKSKSKNNFDLEHFNLLEYPDKYVCLIMNENLNEDLFKENLLTILPSLNQILKLYTKKEHTITDVYQIISNFDYDYTNLNINDRIEIYDNIEENTNMLDKYNKSLNYKYNKKVKKDLQKEETPDKFDDKSKLVNTELIDELLNYYYKTFNDFKTKFDNDISRLNWFNTQFDNGEFLAKNLMLEYYRKCQNNSRLDELNTQLTILKENYQRMSDSRPQDLVTPKLGDSINKCNVRKITKPKIIKYPSIKRLEADNQKVISDTDGEIILPGDYALIKDDDKLDLFKREGLTDGDVWVREDISTLQKLINDSKEICNTTNLQLDDDECLFDENNFICNPVELVRFDNNLDDLQTKINDLQMHIEFVNSLPTLIKKLEKEVKEYRDILVNKLNSEKKYWKNKLLVSKEEDIELSKTIYRLKDCIHFNVSDYFHKIPVNNSTLEEKFILANSIFDKFLNTENASYLNINNVDKDDNNNWTTCNICNQHLLCKHYYYGVEMRKLDREVDFNDFISIYGIMSNESYYCKICGELLGNTQALDVDEFGGGENGKRIVTREVNEETTLYELQKEKLDNTINTLIKNQESGDDYELGIDIFKLLKMLIGNKDLRIEDEYEMINFIQHFNFIKKSFVRNNVIKKYGSKIKNKTILSKLINKYYYIYYIVDICARFLITIQTSNYIYNVHNKLIKTNYIGYPVIDDINEKDGMNLIVSLIFQIGTLDKYSYLNDKDAKIEQKLLERLKYQIETSEYIKNKIINNILDKETLIDNIETFNNYITNHWVDFRPSLQIAVSWNPDKIISETSLKDLTFNNYFKMLDVSAENKMHNIYSLMKYVNNIVNGENVITELTKRTNLGNSCCMEDINIGDNYLTYFYHKNRDIESIVSKINKLNEIDTFLKSKLEQNVYHLLFVPIINNALEELKLNLEPNKDDIMKIFNKYVHSGEFVGEEHIFNNLNQCIISGFTKQEKENIHFDMNTFVNLFNIIKRKKQVHLEVKPLTLTIYKEDNEIHSELLDTNELLDSPDKKFSLTMDDVERNQIKIIEDEYVLLNNLIDLIPQKDESYNFIYNYLKLMIDNGFIAYYDKFNQEEILERIKNFQIENDIKTIYQDSSSDATPEIVVDIDNTINENNLLNNDIAQKKKLMFENMNIPKNKVKFDINKHLALLNTQISIDIENLLNKLNLNSKDRKKLESKINYLGEYVELSNEYKEKLELNNVYTDNNNSNSYENNKQEKYYNHRYKLRENGIHKDLKYLKDILNQIINGKLDNIEDKSNVRPQFRDFIKFSKNKELFQKIKNHINTVFNLSKLIISRDQYTLLFSESTSLLLQYLILFCVSSIYNFLYDSGLKDKLGKISTIVGSIEDNDANVIDKDSEILEKSQLDIQYDDEEEDKQKDDIEFKIQKSTNLAIVIEFIKSYFKKIFENQEIYDSLTQNKIKEVMAKHQQKQQERNLKIFSFLSKEGQEEEYNMILNKLSIGKLGFKDLSEYMSQVYGDNLFEVNDIGDAIEDENYRFDDKIDMNEEERLLNNDNQRKNNELGLDNYEYQEMAYVGDADEGMEEQDYGYMMVEEE